MGHRSHHHDEHDRHELVAARAELVDRGSTARAGAVAPHVLASWRRSIDCGVAPDGVESTYFDDLDADSGLVSCATPVIERLALQLVDGPMSIVLADDRARILVRRDLSSEFGRAADRVFFAEGFGYAEGAVGTNGVGTVLEYGASVQIVGAEHFSESLQGFACAGAPIRNPFTRRIEGVLDVSCFARDSTPILHSMVRTAAEQIEQLLVAERSSAQQALFEAYVRVEARSRGAVVAVGPQLSIATARAEALLDPVDLGVVHDHLRFRSASVETLDDQVDLPSGQRVRLRGKRITAGVDVAGTVCLVEAVDVGVPVLTSVPRAQSGSPDPAVARRTARIAESRVPAVRAAAVAVSAAWDRDHAVAVLGERGSGRTTLLRAEVARRSPGAEVVLCPVETVESDPAWVGEVLAQPRAASAVVVLQDLDQLSVDAAAELAVVVGHAQRRCLLGATWTSGTDPGPEHAELLSWFASSVTMPALRHRTADLATLTATLVAELAPHRDVRLSREAERVIAAYGWPGNATELREALRRALRARPVGEIEAGDLPASCHSAPRRHLRLVERAERDVIVDALRDAGGNRKAAAEALGLARSTLYRKLEHYGIDA